MQKPPVHIAIIMDGNGRWAEKRRLPKIAGHKRGIKVVEEIIKAAKELGIKILTLYTFSTENWKRPKKEVDVLMSLLDSYLGRDVDRLIKEGVKIRAIGRIEDLPSGIRTKLKRVEERTNSNDKIRVNFALSYGGRAEIVDACKKMCIDAKANRINPSRISEESFSEYLYTKDMPDPDILIRTSGEMRVSNFLLWQISYSEIYVTKKLWPDFKKKDLEKVLEEFNMRDRRYGG